MNKKIASKIALGVILLVVLVVGSALWMQSKKISEQTATSSIPQQTTQANNASQQGRPQSDIYQKIQIKNPKATFSFEAPDNWIVETRNSGEKKMSNAEIKNFLSTGETRMGGYWKYYEITPQELNKKTETELLEIMRRFPIASVAKTSLQYTDWSDQIDFYLENYNVSEEINSLKNELCTGKCSVCKTTASNKGDCIKQKDNNCTTGKQKIAGFDADFIKFDVSIYDGKAIGDKECTGGLTYFITIGNGTVLKIKKQQLGDEQYEKDFQHLIQTLKIENK